MKFFLSHLFHPLRALLHSFILLQWWHWIINIPTGWQSLVISSDPVMVGYLYRITSPHVSQGHPHISSWRCPEQSMLKGGTHRIRASCISGLAVILPYNVYRRGPSKIFQPLITVTDLCILQILSTKTSSVPRQRSRWSLHPFLIILRCWNVDTGLAIPAHRHRRHRFVTALCAQVSSVPRTRRPFSPSTLGAALRVLFGDQLGPDIPPPPPPPPRLPLKGSVVIYVFQPLSFWRFSPSQMKDRVCLKA